MAGPEYFPPSPNERRNPPSSDNVRNRGPFFPRQKPSPPPDQGPVPAMPARR